ncbi:electron transfer flavoprotein alpha subunit apoprotein [Salana multivorans]|uniref:Electron transfer flavoprotein alpha subunit apoprotein n=1 Tax=Salana multivorans TaxID=120377 RepID=A0A3N2D772_9MICO|nr:FAD-binding protein [Salana multivorans]ROR95626.1 electron transfer flavoprotein alpha subunit apoprotein [Salana multivorans]
MSSPVLLVASRGGSDDLVHLAADAAGGAELRGVAAFGGTPRALARLLVACARRVGATRIVLESSRRAAEVAAYVAHDLDAGILADVLRVRRDGDVLVGEKRELGGTWDVTCSVAGPVVVLARPAAWDGPVPDVGWLTVEEFEAAEADVRAAAGEGAAIGRDVEPVSIDAHDVEGVALASAAVVVAGGRGLEGDLTPVRALADALGGAVGATRDIVEEEWIGPEAMVGQTGTMIAPRLYVGAGLSGAPHHMLGMRAAETIVAVNLDPEAPIMEVADLAVVGDAAAILTEAAELVRERRGR